MFAPNIDSIVNSLYPPVRQALALEVASIDRRLFWLGAAVQLVIFAWLYYSGASAALRAWLEQRVRRRFLVSALLVTIVIVASAIVTLPLTWYGSFTIPHRYDLSRESPALWLHDWALELVLTIIVVVPLGALFFSVVRRAPRTWPLIAAAAAAPLVLVASVILPVFIEPLFNEFKPLPPSPLTNSILQLAAAHGVHASRVYVYDFSKQSTVAQAYVSGIGGSERIALSDTLLTQFKPDEALYVTAHELGHYVHRDLWWGTLYAWLGACLTIAFVYLAGPWLVRRSSARATSVDDPAATPLIFALLLAFALLTQPIVNAISRQIEHNADAFAAANTHLGDAGVRAFARLGSEALAPLHPPPLVVWYFYTHPPLDERIRFAAEQAGLLR